MHSSDISAKQSVSNSYSGQKTLIGQLKSHGMKTRHQINTIETQLVVKVIIILYMGIWYEDWKVQGANNNREEETASV
eukprot:2224-Heterococcus_DN1.PRE.4